MLLQAPSEPSEGLQESLAEVAHHEYTDDHVQYLATEVMHHMPPHSSDSEETSSTPEGSGMAQAVDPSDPTTLAAGPDTAQLPSPELAMGSPPPVHPSGWPHTGAGQPIIRPPDAGGGWHHG